jgi:hypothetical protein
MHIIGISTITLMLEAPVSLKAQWLMWTTGDGHHFVYPQVSVAVAFAVSGHAHSGSPVT